MQESEEGGEERGCGGESTGAWRDAHQLLLLAGGDLTQLIEQLAQGRQEGLATVCGHAGGGGGGGEGERTVIDMYIVVR